MLEAATSGSNSVVECQLPKLDVAGSTPVSRSIFQQLRKIAKIFHFIFTPLSGKNTVFKLLCHFGPPGKTDLRVNIQRHPNSMPALVGGYFRIDTGLVTEAGMRPA